MGEPLHVVIIGAGQYAQRLPPQYVRVELNKYLLSGICGLLIAQGLEKVGPRQIPQLEQQSLHRHDAWEME